MQLKSYHEIIGFLHAVSEEDSCCKLQFSCNHELELPLAAIKKKKLAAMVGRKVGIFNCNGSYMIRIIKD